MIRFFRYIIGKLLAKIKKSVFTKIRNCRKIGSLTDELFAVSYNKYRIGSGTHGTL